MQTYVMGYWLIPGNPKNPPAHYAHLLPDSLKLVRGRNLVFYFDNAAVATTVRRLCAEYGIRFEMRQTPVDDLPRSADAARIVERTQQYGAALDPATRNVRGEKGYVHYWRDLLKSDTTTFRQVLSVWLSKLDLLAEVCKSNPFGTETFSWIDASISRCNGNRPKWDFTQLQPSLGRLMLYPGMMMKRGELLRVSASFLSGSCESIAGVLELYGSELKAHLTEVYPNDEETVLSAVEMKLPELFHVIR